MNVIGKGVYTQGIYWSVVGLVLYCITPTEMRNGWMLVEYIFSLYLLLGMIIYTANCLASLTNSEHVHTEDHDIRLKAKLNELYPDIFPNK